MLIIKHRLRLRKKNYTANAVSLEKYSFANKNIKTFFKEDEGGRLSAPFLLFGSPHSPDKSSSAAVAEKHFYRIITVTLQGILLAEIIDYGRLTPVYPDVPPGQ